MTLTVFENAVVFDGESPDLIEGVNVIVEGDRIREITREPVRYSVDRVVDVTGRTIIPGLIDAHIHVYAAYLDSRLTADMPHTLAAVHAAHRLKSMLERGFTTVRDVAGGDFGIKQAIDQQLIPGPRLFIAGRALSITGGHGDHRKLTDPAVPCACSGMNASDMLTRITDGPTEVRRAVRDELRKGADLVKLLVSGGVGSPYDPLEGRQFCPEEVRAAVDEASAWGTYVAAHSYTPRSTWMAVECGVRTIEHGNFVDAPTAALMAENGTYMVPTLVCYEESAARGPELGLQPVILEKLKLVNEAGIRMLEICNEAGVSMGFGTDLMGELHDAQSREFLIRAQVLDPAHILRSATSINAAILNRQGELGCIRPGALADLLVIDGNPLADLGLLQEQGRHMPVIMKAGEFYKNTL